MHFLTCATLVWAFVMFGSLAQANQRIAQLEDEAPAEYIDEEDFEPGTEAESEEVGSVEEPSASDVANQEIQSEVTEEAEAAEEVEVEESPYVTEQIDLSDDQVVNYLRPYRERRLSWGSLVAVGVSGYSPSNYDPDFVLDQFDDYYGSAETPLVELTVSAKKNFSFGSILLEVGAGYYSNSGGDDSLLTLTPFRLGLGYTMDTVFEEPYVVPYGTVGAYTVLYKETVASQSVNGNTAIGIYYAGGLRFQLDWIDRDGDYASFDENGIENTFLYVEARTFLLPSDSLPDLGSSDDQPINIGAGLSMEF